MTRRMRSLAALPLALALLNPPLHAQQPAAEEEVNAEEIYQIMIACTSYTTLVAQMAGEEETGPNRDLSTRFTRAAVIMEPQQSAANVDSAVAGGVGSLIIRQMDESQKAKTDADFAVLDKNCKQIDRDILTPLLAEIDAQKK